MTTRDTMYALDREARRTAPLNPPTDPKAVQAARDARRERKAVAKATESELRAMWGDR